MLLAGTRVRTVFDEGLRAFVRDESTEVGEALFGDNYIDVVFGMIDMGDHRHDTGDVPTAGDRRKRHDTNRGIPIEVSTTADTVLDVRSADVCRIHVPVDIHLKRAVDAYDPESVDKCGVIRDVPVPYHDIVSVPVGVLEEPVESVFGER